MHTFKLIVSSVLLLKSKTLHDNQIIILSTDMRGEVLLSRFTLCIINTTWSIHFLNPDVL